MNMTDDDLKLNERMIAAGMSPLKDLLEGCSLDKWRVHTHVTDIPSLLEVAECKHKEYTKTFIRYELGKEKDDMYEWTLAHMAVWGDVVFNLRAAIERSK